MWFMPSRGRPHLLERFFKKKVTTPGIVAVDYDQADDYFKVKLPDGWKFDVSGRCPIVHKVNILLLRYPSEKWYGLVTDDMVPETDGWDRILAERAGDWNIAWSPVNNRPMAIAFGGEFIRALEYIMCPAVKHFYADDAFELMAKELGNGVQCDDVVVKHYHFTNGKAPYDKTYKERPHTSDDKVSYHEWLKSEWPQTKERMLSVFSSRAASTTQTG